MATLEVNNILCYISTARHAKTDEQILQYCLPFYDLNDIREAKDILCKLSNERNTKRRGDNSKTTEISDILDLFRKYDDTNISIPKYVADSFNAMPPTAGYDLLSPLLVSLIEEIQNLKEDMKNFKDVNTTNDIILNDSVLIKGDLIDIKSSLRDLKLKFYESDLHKIDQDKNNTLMQTDALSFIASERKNSLNNGSSILNIPITHNSSSWNSPQPSPLRLISSELDTIQQIIPSAPTLSQFSD